MPICEGQLVSQRLNSEESLYTSFSVFFMHFQAGGIGARARLDEGER